MATAMPESERNPLDFLDTKASLRASFPTGFETYDEGNPDPSNEWRDVIEKSSYYQIVLKFIKTSSERDPSGSVHDNHFRKGCEKEAALYMRHAFYFFKKAYPQANNRSCLTFAAIAFVEGPDYALRSYGNQNSVWFELVLKGKYKRPMVLFGDENETFNLYLEHLRHLFYGHISHREDPRGSTHYGPILSYLPYGTPVMAINPVLRYSLPAFKAESESVSMPPTPKQIGQTTQRRPHGQTLRQFEQEQGEDFSSSGSESESDEDDLPASGDLGQSYTQRQDSTRVSTAQPPQPQPQPANVPVTLMTNVQLLDALRSNPPASLLDRPPSTSQGLSVPLQPGQQNPSIQATRGSNPAVVTLSTSDQRPFIEAPRSAFQAVSSSASVPPSFTLGPNVVASIQQSRTPPVQRGIIPSPRQRISSRQSQSQALGDLQPLPRDEQGSPSMSRLTLEQQQQQDDYDEYIHRDDHDFPDQRRGRRQRRSPPVHEIMTVLNGMAMQMKMTHDCMRKIGEYIERSESRASERQSQRSSPHQESSRHVAFDSRNQEYFYQTQDGSFRPIVSPSQSDQGSLVRPVPHLPRVGHVIDPTQSYPLKRRVPLPNKTDPVIQFGRDFNLDPTLAGLALGFSKAHRKSTKESRAADFTIETVNPLSNKTNIDSFDYKTNGRTAEEILGERFKETYFANENARLATMRAIFQRVADDPYCTDKARSISLSMLGQFDPPREQTNNMLMSTINTMGALTDAYPGGLFSDDDLIEPPLLGNLMISDPAVTKELYFYLGLPMGEKFKLGGSRPLRFYLHGVSSRITMMRMCQDSAYSLLLTILEGDLYDEVQRLKDQKVPFNETWIYIQNCASGSISKDELGKELDALFKVKPKHIMVALSRIQEIRIQQMRHVKNKTKRENVTTVVTNQDFQNFIKAHYGPTVAAAIETQVAHAMAKEDKKRQLCEIQGLAYKTSFCEVRCFKEIACRYINQMVEAGKGPSMIFSSSLDAESDDLAMIISSLTANSAALAAPSTPGPLISASMQSHGPHSLGASDVSGFNQNSTMNLQNQQLQAALKERDSLNQQALQARNQYENQKSQIPSSFPPPDFTKLLLPVERSMTRRDRSGVPQICWNTIGTNICFLCAVRNHFYDECPLYPNQMPGEHQCLCKGFHQSECRSHLRNMMDLVRREGWHPPPKPVPREGYNEGAPRYDNPRGGFDRRRGSNRGGYRGNGNGYRGNDRRNNDDRRGYRNDRRDYEERRGNDERRDYIEDRRNNYENRRGDGRNGSNGRGREGRAEEGNKERFGFPNQAGDHVTTDHSHEGGPTVRGASPGGKTANRAGGGLGNSGNQAAPDKVYMNTGQVKMKNKKNQN